GKFIVEFHESKVAFKTADGKYLQGVGATGVLCERRTQVGKDELFELEDSHPQVTLRGPNGRYLSNRQTDEVKADQNEVEDTEIFQMELMDGKWAFRNQKNKFWTLSGTKSIVAEASSVTANELFTVDWKGPQVA